jgi:hypothetical protein
VWPPKDHTLTGTGETALLNSASYLRENVIRIGPDQPDGSNYNYQDDSKHHCVLGNILSLFICPESLNKLGHANLLRNLPKR